MRQKVASLCGMSVFSSSFGGGKHHQKNSLLEVIYGNNKKIFV